MTKALPRGTLWLNMTPSAYALGRLLPLVESMSPLGREIITTLLTFGCTANGRSEGISYKSCVA